MILTDLQTWNQELAGFPEPTLLQTSTWARVKESYGWKSFPLKWVDGNKKTIAMAMVLKRQVQFRKWKLPLSMLYVPKGPILDWENGTLVRQVLQDLIQFGKDQKAFLIKIEPEIRQFIIPNQQEQEVNNLHPLVTPSFLEELGWRFSENQIQFRNSVHIDLLKQEDELLADMKQKTRYNIRLAERKGVIVREGSENDFEEIFKMYVETSVRDNFIIRPKDYYFKVWDSFYKQGLLTPLIAYFENQPLAALMLFHFQKTAYYLYGMSTEQHRNWMPTYLLQWEAIKKAQNLGCETYDLWGAPNSLEENDPMWGVYRFKVGLGGTTIGTIGAWDFILQPAVHHLFSQIVPTLLNILRKHRKTELAESL